MFGFGRKDEDPEITISVPRGTKVNVEEQDDERRGCVGCSLMLLLFVTIWAITIPM